MLPHKFLIKIRKLLPSVIYSSRYIAQHVATLLWKQRRISALSLGFFPSSGTLLTLLPLWWILFTQHTLFKGWRNFPLLLWVPASRNPEPPHAPAKKQSHRRTDYIGLGGILKVLTGRCHFFPYLSKATLDSFWFSPQRYFCSTECHDLGAFHEP